MLKKMIIGVLLLTVIGAAAAAYLYQSSRPATAASTLPDPLAANTTVNQPTPVVPGGNGQTNVNATTPGTPVAQGAEGDPWQASGTIAGVDDFGFDMTLDTSETVYIELGPPTYWQTQGITLTVGQGATVIGTINEGMIHASQVQLADGSTLQVRSDTGQPLWSGGATNGQGQGAAAGTADGSRTPDPQVQVDAWITITGTIMAYQGNSMTVAADDGQLITLQSGQPRFFAAQGVTFQVGDEVIIVGFYQGDQFMAGDITQVATGLRVLLRDPNGRPLWAGVGNNGNGGGGGQGGGGGGQGRNQ
ncbi:MAG: hypothetical protein KA314_16475 [Chloroflexi bacterium]|nr:hypothetical protein [Chloroflexota bacterium]MBP8057429.1 hypothetical protein [Chloroflexota bacterium]